MARMELTEQARLDATRGRARRLRKATSNISSHLLVALVVLIVILPFYVAIVYSFRLEGEIHANGLEWPDHFTLENYRQVIFENQQFATGYVNSILNTVPTVFLLMSITSMTAWVLARFETKFYLFMYAVLTLGLLIPFQCFELPLFVNWRKLGLDSTNLGFILARAGLQISISLVAVTGFIKTVPRDLEDAAGIDGCNRFQVFWKVVFPLMTPINVTQLVLNSLFIWNDYSTAIILLRDKSSYTLTLAQIMYFNENTTMINQAFAFFVLAMLPILILYLCMQKHIVSGITAGAVKG